MHTPLCFSDPPVEFGVEILEYLRGDSQALHSFCLTSKLWPQHAQPILYKSIRISPANVSLFCDTIRQRPELASHIQKLTLDGLAGTPRPPLELLPTRIEVLRVVGMELPNPWVRTALSTSRSYVQELVFRDCCMADPQPCLALPELLPCLKRFEIDQSWLRSRNEAHNTLAHMHGFSLPDARSLSLTSDPAVPRDWSGQDTRPLPGGNLSVLKVLLDGPDTRAFGEFLQTVARYTRVYPTEPGQVREPALDIELLPPGPFRRLPRTYLSCVPTLLESLPGRCEQLTQVGFTARMARLAPCAELDALDWERVGRFLAWERFASLRRVSARVVGDSYGLREHTGPYSEEKLRVLVQRKLLRCCVSSPKADA